MKLREWLKVLYSGREFKLQLLDHNNIEYYNGTVSEFLTLSELDCIDDIETIEIDFCDIYSERQIVVWFI